MDRCLHVISLSLLLMIGDDATAADRLTTPSPLERAEELIAASKPEAALAALSAYHPTHEELFLYHYAYARALVQANKPYESIEHFRLASIYAGSDAEQKQMQLQRAEVYAKMGYDTEAAVCYDVFLKKYSASDSAERAEMGAAEARYRLGEYREAFAHYERAGTSHRATSGRANTLQHLGRTAEAQDLYRSLIENDPAVINSSPETLYTMAENFRQAGKLNDAKIYFHSVKEPPWTEKARIGLGMTAMSEGQPDEAARHFEAASASPDRLVKRQAVLSLGEVYLRLGRRDDAERALTDVRKNYPYSSQYDAATLLLAQLHKSTGNYPASIPLLKELIFRRTPSGAALDALEAILLEAKDKNKGSFVKLWNEAGRWLMEPSRSSSLITIAKGLRDTGKPFIDVCSWLIKYGSGDAKTEARLLLADFYAGLGDAAIASGYLKRAKAKGQSDEALRVKASIFLSNNEAVNASEAIMALHEVHETDILFLLDVMASIGDIRKAAGFCDTTFRKTPAAPSTYVRFADLLAAAGMTTDALRYYRAAVAADSPNNNRRSDVEWAHFRIAALSNGEDALASLKAIQTTKGAVGRFAAAELKATAMNLKTAVAGPDAPGPKQKTTSYEK